MAQIKDAYTITVEHEGRSLSAVMGPRQVEEWVANQGGTHAMTGTLREVLHALIREVMGVPA